MFLMHQMSYQLITRLLLAYNICHRHDNVLNKCVKIHVKQLRTVVLCVCIRNSLLGNVANFTTTTKTTKFNKIVKGFYWLVFVYGKGLCAVGNCYKYNVWKWYIVSWILSGNI